MTQGCGLTSLEYRYRQPSGNLGLLSLSKLRASSQNRLSSCFPVRIPLRPKGLPDCPPGKSWKGSQGYPPPLSCPINLPHSPEAIPHSSGMPPS